MKQNKKYVKLLVVLTIFAIFTTTITMIYTHLKPIKSIVIEEFVGNDVISAKQIEEYLITRIDTIEEFSKFDFAIGSIDMHLDSDHKGEVTVTIVERNKKNPKIICAFIDTKTAMLKGFSYLGNDSKLYPGQIFLQNWAIDSTDAIKISTDFLSSAYEYSEFRYDEIWLYSYNNSLVDNEGDMEAWCVSLTDEMNDIRYFVRLNPYSGEITNHYTTKL